MKKRVISYIFFLIVFFGSGAEFIYSQIEIADGFASVEALGRKGTTGGAGGYVTTVTTDSQFIDYIGRTGSYVIQVDGTIHLSDMVNVKSDKTIVGVDSNGVITGSGLNFSTVSNIIVRNIRFENITNHLSDDAVNIENASHHIWIDHCEFSNGRDGLVDIKRGSDYITVSWNVFTNHEKTCLLGHDDANAAQDSGHLRVTYHHNWFNLTNTRHPRVRFSALCHAYNNYYKGNQYGVASTMGAEVLVENNYFLRVASPTRVGYVASGVGDLVERDNIYDQCALLPETRGEVPDPPYIYSPDKASDIPQIVEQGAGRNGFVFIPAENPDWLVYNGNVLPNINNPPFSETHVVNPPDTTSWIIEDPEIEGNRLLRFINPVQESSTFMWGNSWNMNDSTGATIAFRIKPVDRNVYGCSGDVEFSSNGFKERFSVLSNGKIRLNNTDVQWLLPYGLDEWHTYRITFQNGFSNLYLDEEKLSVLSGEATSENPDDSIRFGDSSSENATGFLLDWFIYDTTGAYEPGSHAIPETLFVDRPPVVSQWQIYDASVFPSENDPAFSGANIVNASDTTTWIVDDPEIYGNKLLKFINAAKGVSKFMWGHVWGMDDESGATFAFRVKPIDRELYGRTFEVEFRDGKQRERFVIQSDGSLDLIRADINQMLPSRLDGWHTYRITYQNGISTVYLDEENIPFISGTTPSANAYNDIRFGDGSDDNTHGFYLDWFIFDITGVYAPGESDIPKELYVDDPESTDVNIFYEALLKTYRLEQNYPNPFNAETRIRFHLLKSGQATVTVYNIQGQLVRVLCNQKMDRGAHEILFDAGDCPSGIYFCRIDAGHFRQVKKMVLLR